MMRCSIADLVVELPAVGDLVPRCREYLCCPEGSADIIVRTEAFRAEVWQELDEIDRIYMESGAHFGLGLLDHCGLVLHSCAVVYEGKAYLFSGNSGVGKSTHSMQWQAAYGDKVKVINDDKPALRCVDGKWIAYGTPWCGKNRININASAPLAGICFLKQAEHNAIRPLDKREVLDRIVRQTAWNYKKLENLEKYLVVLDKLVSDIPFFELENRPEPAAAVLSCETMKKTAEELGL